MRSMGQTKKSLKFLFVVIHRWDLSTARRPTLRLKRLSLIKKNLQRRM